MNQMFQTPILYYKIIIIMLDDNQNGSNLDKDLLLSCK